MKRLSERDVRTAATLLLSARAGTTELPCLPTELTPEHTADVQAIIDTVSAGIERPARGWKIYSAPAPTQPPVIAPIYDVFPSGTTVPADISPKRLIEPEIMFRIDRALPARDHNYEIAEIQACV